MPKYTVEVDVWVDVEAKDSEEAWVMVNGGVTASISEIFDVLGDWQMSVCEPELVEES